MYEMMVIIPPSGMADPEATLAIIKEAIAKQGGEIIQTQELGEKELAYPIKKMKAGYYFLFDLRLPLDAISKLSNLFNLTPEILRYMIVKKTAQKKAKTKEVKQAIQEETPTVKKEIDLELGL